MGTPSFFAAAGPAWQIAWTLCSAERMALFLGSVALGFTATTLFALWRLQRRGQAPVSEAAPWPPIAVLRPCQGSEPSLLRNLLASATARYDGPRRVFLLVPDRHDPAFAIAEAAAAGAPGVTVVVTDIGGPGTVQNRKVAQLCAGDRAAQRAAPLGEIVVQADSDVLFDDHSLPGVVTALRDDPRCGACFAAPVEIAPVTLADRASAALVNASHQSFLALFALSRLLGGTPSLAGALCAYRREALVAIGGFPALRTILGEDYEAARRLRAAGYPIALSPAPARCTDGGRNAREVIARVARWMMVVRAQRPGLLASYPLLLGATPLLFGLAAVLRSPRLGLVALALLAARTGLSLVLRRMKGLAPGLPSALRDAVLSEALIWLALPAALFRRGVTWRGHRYRIARGGVLWPG